MSNTIIQSALSAEDIEGLADRIEETEKETREKLLRLIRAEARILAVREPAAFPKKPLARADEDGHWDSSFPPDIEWKDHNGPRLFCVDGFEWEENDTGGGSFYHNWEAVTSSPGLYVARDGRLFGAEVSGTGRVGQFAAHPGDCDVDMVIDWSPLDLDDVTTEALRTVERVVRERAFPSLKGATKEE